MAESIKHSSDATAEWLEHSQDDDIPAKRVKNYVWNGANWIRQDSSSGGGLATVTVLGLPTVSVSAMPTISVGALPSVNGNVAISSLPTVSVGNTLSVQGLPTVSVAALPSVQGKMSIIKGTTTAITCMSGSTTSLTLKATNNSRVRLTVHNNSTNKLYVKEGATASTTSYTYLLSSGDCLILDDYVGQVDGVWDGVNGSAQVSETT